MMRPIRLGYGDVGPQAGQAADHHLCDGSGLVADLGDKGGDLLPGHAGAPRGRGEFRLGPDPLGLGLGDPLADFFRVASGFGRGSVAGHLGLRPDLASVLREPVPEQGGADPEARGVFHERLEVRRVMARGRQHQFRHQFVRPAGSQHGEVADLSVLQQFCAVDVLAGDVRHDAARPARPATAQTCSARRCRFACSASAAARHSPFRSGWLPGAAYESFAAMVRILTPYQVGRDGQTEARNARTRAMSSADASGSYASSEESAKRCWSPA
ncbi:hypothetical protein GCM10027161_00210 [Microbispora hainanensis]